MAGHRLEDYSVYQDNGTLTLREYQKARKDNPEGDRKPSSWLMNFKRKSSVA